MTLENCDTKSSKDNSSNPDCNNDVQDNPIPKRTEKYNQKKAKVNGDQNHSNEDSHISGLVVTLIIVVMLIVLGTGSYFYELHKITESKKLSVVKVDISSYPKVRLHLKSEGFTNELESGSFSVKEVNSYPKNINLINDGNNSYVLEYTSLLPPSIDTKIPIYIYYQDHNKFIDLKTDYQIKTAKKSKEKAR